VLGALGMLISENAGGGREKVGRIIGHSDASSRRGMGNAQGRDVTECALLWKREDIIVWMSCMRERGSGSVF
jgi:hypothetical protein